MTRKELEKLERDAATVHGWMDSLVRDCQGYELLPELYAALQAQSSIAALRTLLDWRKRKEGGDTK